MITAVLLAYLAYPEPGGQGRGGATSIAFHGTAPTTSPTAEDLTVAERQGRGVATRWRLRCGWSSRAWPGCCVRGSPRCARRVRAARRSAGWTSPARSTTPPRLPWATADWPRAPRHRFGRAGRPRRPAARAGRAAGTPRRRWRPGRARWAGRRDPPWPAGLSP